MGPVSALSSRIPSRAVSKIRRSRLAEDKVRMLLLCSAARICVQATASDGEPDASCARLHYNSNEFNE
jgi:hypothetical protein